MTDDVLAFSRSCAGATVKPGWFAFPDHLVNDQTICRIGRADAVLALVAAYSEAERAESDGFVPRGVVVAASSERVAADLIAAGFFREIPGGLEIVGFLDINQTREQREGARQAAADRTKRWRDRVRDASRDGVTDAVSDAPCDVQGQGQVKEQEKGRGTTTTAPPARPPEEPPPSSKVHVPEIVQTPPKKRRDRKPQDESKPPPDRRRVTDHWNAVWAAVSRDRYDWGAERGRHMKAVDDLLVRMPLDEVLDRIDRFFSTRLPAWVWKDCLPDFPKFVSVINQVGTGNGLLSGPNSFMNIGRKVGHNGENVDALPGLFAPHPRDERGTVPEPGE